MIVHGSRNVTTFLQETVQDMLSNSSRYVDDVVFNAEQKG